MKANGRIALGLHCICDTVTRSNNFHYSTAVLENRCYFMQFILALFTSAQRTGINPSLNFFQGLVA